MSFCRLTKGIIPKMCRLCVHVIINKRSFESFMCFGPSVLTGCMTARINVEVLAGRLVGGWGEQINIW